jgi:hypothetical protein
MSLFLFIMSIVGLFLLLLGRTGKLSGLPFKFRRGPSGDIDGEIAKLEAETAAELSRADKLQRLLEAKRRLHTVKNNNAQLSKAISGKQSAWVGSVSPTPRPNRGSAYRRSR